MAAALHLCGVTTPNCTVSSRRYFRCQPLWLQRLDFTLSVAGGSRLCRSVKDSSRKGVLRVCCSGGFVDVLEKSITEDETADEVTEQLTIAMKFGGSSVASAERMREVADLILSFPNERPVIVLSAMGKTTNKLSLVQILVVLFFFLFSFISSFPCLFCLYGIIYCLRVRLVKRRSVAVFLMHPVLMS